MSKRTSAAPGDHRRARAEVYTIGIIAGVPQPVAADEQLRNLPDEAIFNWEPSAQFGIYRPDSFWFEDGPGEEAGGSAKESLVFEAYIWYVNFSFGPDLVVP